MNEYTPREYKINNNRTGTNIGGKLALSYAHVIHIYLFVYKIK